MSESVDFKAIVMEMWKHGGQPDHVHLHPSGAPFDYHNGYPVPSRVHRRVSFEDRARLLRSRR